MEYEDSNGNDAEEIREILLRAANREWSLKERMRFIALRDQFRAAVLERNPDLKDSMPPLDY